MRRRRRSCAPSLWKWLIRLLLSTLLVLCGIMMSPIPGHEMSPFENLEEMASSATMMMKSSPTIRANSPNSITDKRTPEDPTISAVMQHLRKLGIQLLAFDFDQTIIDIHTGGNWDGSAEELIPHIRPIMSQLIQAAAATTTTTVADGSSMAVAIVTFSGQTDLIENVMDHILADAPGAKRNIPVYGDYCCSQYQGAGSTDGKQAHISTALQELGVAGTKFQKSTTLLIDDDRNNIKYAELDSTRAVWFHPEEPGLLLLQEILRLTEKAPQ